MPRTDYQLFQKFITKYLPKGFVGINRQDSLIVKIEEQLKTSSFLCWRCAANENSVC